MMLKIRKPSLFNINYNVYCFIYYFIIGTYTNQ